MTQGDEIEPEEIEGEEHDSIEVEPDLVLERMYMSEFGSHTADEPCPAKDKGWCPCQDPEATGK